MQPPPATFRELTGHSRRVARRLLTIGANRLALLRVEVQEERMLLLRAIFMGFGIAALVLLAGIALTGMAVILFYESAPEAVLLVLACLYVSAAALLYRRLHRLLCEWQNLPASVEQLRKDRACLEDIMN